MTIKVTSSYTMQNALAVAYKNTATAMMLFSSTTPVTTGAATGEVSGGSPAYARKTPTWAASATNGVLALSADVTFDIPSGGAVGAVGVCTSTTAGTADVLDWAALGAVQNFGSQGTFKVLASGTSITIT